MPVKGLTDRQATFLKRMRDFGPKVPKGMHDHKTMWELHKKGFAAITTIYSPKYRIPSTAFKITESGIEAIRGMI